jgi:murein endopeptidase
VTDLYAKYGDRLSAVPAPENLPTEQIEANIDRIFALDGPGKKATLKALKDGDLARKSALSRKLFDGVKTLDEGAFAAIAGKIQSASAAKAGGVMAGGFEASPDAAAGAGGPDAAAAANPASNADDGPLSAEQRRRYARRAEIPSGRGWSAGYAPPPVGTWEPPSTQAAPVQRPYVADAWNRYAPNFAQDLAAQAGGWAANKIWGGGDPAVNVELPPDNHSPDWYRRVRFGNYGTMAMIKGLLDSSADMAQLRSPTIPIGDISQRGGGSFRRHLSHKIGKDVDIFFITDSRGRFDVPWNLTLAAAAMKHMNVTKIFVDTSLKNLMAQYLAQNPQLPPAERQAMAAALGRMQYWPGHDTHFHIRIDY